MHPGRRGAAASIACERSATAGRAGWCSWSALITNPPKAGQFMWVFARKAMFCKGAATPGLNKVGGIMIKALVVDDLADSR